MRPILLKMGYTAEMLPEVSQPQIGYFQGLYQRVPQNELIDLEKGPEDNKEKLEKALERAYLQNRRQLYQKGMKQETVGTLITPLVLSGGLVAVEVTGIDSSGFAATLFGINILYNLIDGGKPLKPLITNWMYPENDPLYSFEREYALKKPLLNFLDAKDDLKNYSEYKAVPFPEEQFLIARRSPMNMSGALQLLNLFFKIPTQSVNPTLPVKEIEKSLQLYSKEAREIILSACINHQKAYSSTLGLNPQTREFVNLVSTPGTGKSYCVEETGRKMNLPVVTICLAGATPDSLFGTSTIPGLLLEKLGEMQGARNGILFLDELDRVLNDTNLMSVLLPFLEPNNKKFFSAYLKRHIDVSHLFIWVAGNLNFKEAALKNRFHEKKTASLEIVDRDLLLDTVMTTYLPKKLMKGEIVESETQSI
ncbi:AAA family ATPase [Candidatus Bealeia paramacronuclearis]|uniref:AAA family ATPase n=1 Tax=Candidatus Bealeia paramacronuclearis TaxID=1921001 RepID=UPI002F261BE3